MSGDATHSMTGKTEYGGYDPSTNAVRVVAEPRSQLGEAPGEVLRRFGVVSELFGRELPALVQKQYGISKRQLEGADVRQGQDEPRPAERPPWQLSFACH
jgi:hypothetical protein